MKIYFCVYGFEKMGEKCVLTIVKNFHKNLFWMANKNPMSETDQIKK